MTEFDTNPETGIPDTAGYPILEPVPGTDGMLQFVPASARRSCSCEEQISKLRTEILTELKRVAERCDPVYGRPAPQPAPAAAVPPAMPGESNADVQLSVCIKIRPRPELPFPPMSVILAGPRVPIRAGCLANVEQAARDAYEHCDTLDLDLQLQHLAGVIEDNADEDEPVPLMVAFASEVGFAGLSGGTRPRAEGVANAPA